MPYANNKGADQPAYPCSLIRTFVVRCLDSIISLVSIFATINLFQERKMSGGGWKFECQHGKMECVGNLIEVSNKSK